MNAQQDNMTRISIVVPVYNAAHTLDRCVSSLSQQKGNLQIILVNDGSTDNSLAMCLTWAQCDARIEVVSQDNAGVSTARNRGLDRCLGEWVCFVDSDDYLEPDACEKLRSIINNSQTDMVMFGHVVEDATHSSPVIRQETDNLTIVDRDEALRLTLSSHGYKGYIWNRMYRTSVINAQPRIRFSEEAHYCEDLLFNVAYAKRVSSVALTDNVLYHYCDSATSVVHTITEKNETFAVAMDEVMRLLPERLQPLAANGYAIMAMELLFWSYERHDNTRIRRYNHMVHKLWPDYRTVRMNQSAKTRVRMVGARYCPALFCPMWNALKKII